jgi:hypothetical protein
MIFSLRKKCILEGELLTYVSELAVLAQNLD